MFALIIARDAQVFVGETENKTFLGVDRLFLDEQHVNSGVHDEGAKNVQHPGEPLNQLRARQDHCSAHYQSAQNAPFEHAVLDTFVDRKGAENNQKKEEVVDAERLFDQIASKEFQSRLSTRVMQDAQAEQDGERHPYQAEEGGF